MQKLDITAQILFVATMAEKCSKNEYLKHWCRDLQKWRISKRKVKHIGLHYTHILVNEGRIEYYVKVILTDKELLPYQ